MKLLNESDILNKEFRLKVIKFIQSGANQARKREMKKRHDVYKDETSKWVIQKLKSEGLKESTVKLMENRASNISICRKVVDKLARCYNGGVQRESGSETGNEIVARITEYLEFDQKQKKVDRYRKLFKTALSLIVPEEKLEFGKDVYGLKKRTLSPWQFDVLEDAKDAEKMACLILSDYVDVTLLGSIVSAASTSSLSNAKSSATREQTACTFIFWTRNYHFTCDEKGNIIRSLSPEDNLNPIKEIPAVDYAEDREGSFWASGGQDLVDGSILVNTLMTDMFAIAFIQGWGQFVVTGTKIPSEIQGGPHNALVFTYDKDDAEPKVEVVQANPPLGDWMKMIEQLVALLLSTNNLSPSNVSVSLDASQFPSGIAMLIEKSEATAPVEDAQKQFRQNERKEFEIVRKWVNYYAESSQLDEELAEIGAIPEDWRPTTKFMDTKEVTTEKEKLDNIKTRQDIGLNTEIELLKMDRPDLSDEDCKKKLLEIKLERAEKMAEQANQQVEQANDEKNGAIPPKTKPPVNSKNFPPKPKPKAKAKK
jgi:hypothetical protein